jgi:hypothetical protein
MIEEGDGKVKSSKVSKSRAKRKERKEGRKKGTKHTYTHTPLRKRIEEEK